MIGWMLALALFALLVWWLLFRTEGVYLGKRVVIWLYDLYATRYDAIVQLDDVDEHVYLAQPIMAKIHPQQHPLILDVASGTGRLPLALCQHARFEGQIISAELSKGMQRQAIQKIEQQHFTEYVQFVRSDAHRLPFAEQTFDVVTCLEALEFFSEPVVALGEMHRVLKPGGLFLTTQRINEPLMPGRLWDQETMHQKLTAIGFEQISFDDWQIDYMQVWCRRSNHA
jgi:ubiquinone/menaquinone biosynthesis C-methylase UbiE